MKKKLHEIFRNFMQKNQNFLKSGNKNLKNFGIGIYRQELQGDNN